MKEFVSIVAGMCLACLLVGSTTAILIVLYRALDLGKREEK